MRALAAIALLMAAAPGTAAAQALNLTLAPTEGTSLGSRDRLAMPAPDRHTPDGRPAIRRGFVAGVDLGPRTTFGIGLFEGAPKRRIGAPDPARPERNSKRAAVGFSLRF